MRACLFLFFAALFLIPTASAGPLHDAAEAGDAGVLTSLLDGGSGINESDGIATPLYYAIYNRHFEAA